MGRPYLESEYVLSSHEEFFILNNLCPFFLNSDISKYIECISCLPTPSRGCFALSFKLNERAMKKNKALRVSKKIKLVASSKIKEFIVNIVPNNYNTTDVATTSNSVVLLGDQHHHRWIHQTYRIAAIFTGAEDCKDSKEYANLIILYWTCGGQPKQ
ncbi:hypothetical protein CCFV1_ORF078 [Cotesia congregata filamentous virus 1]|uniref:Uncharacterized protein n=1 Tax=Cotesia congregata filamentous virus 1 TaxID=3064291 RepID=A0ABC8QJQ0_9VIRU|nr:hypothetical protein CCFV1_ORF078 [Cotesia congregata filamentous virus 1]